MIRLFPSSERTPAVRILLALLFVGVFAPAFEPGEVFHVHSVRHDPFSGRMLVATGDRDEESWVFWLDSGCGGVEPLGVGPEPSNTGTSLGSPPIPASLNGRGPPPR